MSGRRISRRSVLALAACTALGAVGCGRAEEYTGPELILRLSLIHIFTDDMVTERLQQNPLAYDKDGEMHYDIISAFIKSIRGSDPDGAISVSYTHLDVYKRQGENVIHNVACGIIPASRA